MTRRLIIFTVGIVMLLILSGCFHTLPKYYGM